MKLSVVAKAILVALIATIVSGAPMVAMLTWDMDPGLRVVQGMGLMLIALLGNLAVGLPISLLVLWLIRGQEHIGFWRLLGLANLTATVILVPFLSSGQSFGLLFFGIPIVIAANAFAIAGWFIVLKPTRTSA